LAKIIITSLCLGFGFFGGVFHLSLTSDQDMLEAIEVASDFVGETIQVIEQPSGKMIGVVSEADLFSAYFDIQEHVQDVEK
jgi:CIC family chloride channel protein